MTRPMRADLAAGREPASSSSSAAAADRSKGPHSDDEQALVRYVGSHLTDNQPLAASWDPKPALKPTPEPQPGRTVGSSDSGLLSRVLSTYGWWLYALPVLAVLTVLAVLDVAGAFRPRSPGWDAGFVDRPDPIQEGNAASAGDLLVAPPIPNPMAGSQFDKVKASAELPGGGSFTVQGAGTWQVVHGAGPAFGAGPLITYTVEVEDGVQLEGGPEGFATTVDNTLNNPKSWIGSRQYQFQRIDDSQVANLRISLTSQQTTRALCGYLIPFDASCWKGDQRRVVINNARWARGAVAFQGNVVQYQQYVVNHEVGHGLGFPHVPCPQTGQLAPVMMQQTWGVSNDYLATLGTDRVEADGKTCQPNAWPFPTVN